jgi:3-deoxy-D-manno-octulosonate 8-phosphate phosphatase (KDO 8-P phosphatase)
LVILDVDGVLTDGRITYTEGGEEIKSFNVRDGYGMAKVRKLGITLAIISGRYSKVTEVRAEELSVAHISQGVSDKGDSVRKLLEKTGIDHENALFIGDDVIDIAAMEAVGIGIAVADAHPLAIEEADFVTDLPGGKGAVREVLDYLIAAREK